MLSLSSGVTIESIRNHFFVCDKHLNRWLEISKEAFLCLEKYFGGNQIVIEEELKFIEFLRLNGYLTDKLNDESVSVINQVNNMQIIVETSKYNVEQKKSLNELTNCNDVVLKYNPGINFDYYINLCDPSSVIIDENYMECFLKNCEDLTTSINIIISYKNKSIEDVITYVTELYINGFETINLYYNVDQRNVEKLDSFICLASEYMLGFNWNLAWCLEEYNVDTVYHTLKSVLIAYDKYKFATYPTSPLFKLNGFLPCFKCNFPQNKKYIAVDGSIEFCEHIKRNIDIVPKCCLKDEAKECDGCTIKTFCPYKDPSVCNNNCLGIRFLQEYILCIFSNKLTINENVANLDIFYEQFCGEAKICGKI